LEATLKIELESHPNRKQAVQAEFHDGIGDKLPINSTSI